MRAAFRKRLALAGDDREIRKRSKRILDDNFPCRHFRSCQFKILFRCCLDGDARKSFDEELFDFREAVLQAVAIVERVNFCKLEQVEIVFVDFVFGLGQIVGCIDIDSVFYCFTGRLFKVCNFLLERFQAELEIRGELVHIECCCSLKAFIRFYGNDLDAFENNVTLDIVFGSVSFAKDALTVSDVFVLGQCLCCSNLGFDLLCYTCNSGVIGIFLGNSGCCCVCNDFPSYRRNYRKTCTKDKAFYIHY